MPINDLITVVIPTISERSDLLQEAIASVNAQTTGAPSLVVALDSDRIGPAKVRNSAVSQVVTPWVLFLDDDDILYPNYLETVFNSPHIPTSDMVYTWCDQVGFDAGLDREFDPEVLRGGNYIPVTACVRTPLFRALGGFPTGVAYEDWGLWLKLLDCGAKISLIPEKVWAYRRHAGSRTFENQRAIAEGRIQQV